jgi:GNAT superfamily N-acetyltransferase
MQWLSGRMVVGLPSDGERHLGMNVAYRQARLEDLEPASLVVQEAILDLRSRHGIPLPQPIDPPRFQRLCLDDDPSGLWVAEADGAILGFGFSWMCDRFWFLAQLFVRPSVQASGVGMGLLARTLEQAVARGAENRALITFAYNTRSTGLYARHGLFPREPLYHMAAPAQNWRRKADAGLPAVLFEADDAASDLMGAIDVAVLGFRRDAHHALLRGGQGMRAFRIGDAARPDGYAYIAPNGHVGPLAVAPGADAGAVAATALHCAMVAGPDQISMMVPGRAGLVMATAMAHGLRIEEPLVVLSARPFGVWDRYLPSNPGIM